MNKLDDFVYLHRLETDEVVRLAETAAANIAKAKPDIDSMIKQYQQIIEERTQDMVAYTEHAHWVSSEMWPLTADAEAHAIAMIELEEQRRDEYEYNFKCNIDRALTWMNDNLNLIKDAHLTVYMSTTEHEDYCNVLTIPDLRNIIISYLSGRYLC